ncbi:MAG TPA: hypothetical protein VMB05_03090 [Solirubrobacteraceae bacterium]|nr:hypothetical protein [Solirubrobacteraceae bacterium]
MEQDPAFEQDEIDEAAREAAQIGGQAGNEHLPPPERAVREGGGGESEGFEEAERELIEHTTHGDEQSAHAILHDQGTEEDGEEEIAGDRELSRQLEDE